MDAALGVGVSVSRICSLSNTKSHLVCLDGFVLRPFVARAVLSRISISVSFLFSVFLAVGGMWYAQRYC